MQSGAQTVQEYIDSLPEHISPVFLKLRETILNNIPKGFEEQMSYGMIGYVVPFELYPKGYHCNTKLPLPFVNIAVQKKFIAIYHMGIYANPELMNWFIEEYNSMYHQSPDIGKSCIRFKKPELIPFNLIAELMKKQTVADWIKIYESNFLQRKSV